MADYLNYLRAAGFSMNSIASYEYAIKQLNGRVPTLNDQALLDYKEWLTATFAAKTVNNRITAINNYLNFIEYPGLRLKGLKVQQKPFLDNVISQEEYERLRDGLLRDGDYFWYFVVKFLACTGARISELRRFTVQSVATGHMDIISKGEKLRRVYIPRALQKEAIRWLKDIGKRDGCVFTGASGNALTTRGLAAGLKRCARKYNVDPDVVYPHSFRHRFAKNFIAKNPDIAFLADLMGHESIETTRIYLRRTASEQRAAVDATIDW